MAILPILDVPNPLLKKKAEPVEKVDRSIRKLMSDMMDTMHDAPGIGLAAPQVGELKRVLVVDANQDGLKHTPLKMANPEITWSSDHIVSAEEGCLSVPKQYADVKRPDKIRVRYLDEKNNVQEDDFDELLARVIQHEMDHLDGVLFIDYLSKMKRGMMIKKVQKLRRDEG